MSVNDIRAATAPHGRAGERARPEALLARLPRGTPSSRRFDRLTAKAAEMIGTSIAFVNIFDWDARCFNGHLASHVRGSAMEHIMRFDRLAGSGKLFINDLSKDSRTLSLSGVIDYPNLRFYAGVPIIVDGRTVGTLAVMDESPRPDGICRLDSAALSGLAACASFLLEQPGTGVQRLLSS